MGLDTNRDDGGPPRVAIFTDSDDEHCSGVAAMLTSVLGDAGDDVAARIYAAAAGEMQAMPPWHMASSPGAHRHWYRNIHTYWPRLAACGRQLQSDRVDVIHLTTPGPVGLAGRILARKLGIPTTGSYHARLGSCSATVSRTPRLGLADRYVRWFYAVCDPLLVPSRAAACDRIRRGHKCQRLQLWPPGVDAERFRPDRRSDFLRLMWDVSPRRPAILYAGFLSSEKAADLLPAIRRQLLAWRIDHRLVLVGDGPMRGELRARCPDALFCGAKTHDDVGTVMASADLLLFPSVSDAMGTVVLEAHASGLPVVVSNRGGACELVVDGRTGRIARAGDAVAFADAIASILRQGDVREAMGREARAFALTRTWANAIAPFTKAWRSAARRTARRVGRAAALAPPFERPGAPRVWSARGR